MEPVTHILTGAVLARTGLNRRAAYATAAMAIAAEFPDVDTVSSLFGPVSGLEHHRGITHTFVAVPFEAATITLAFYAFYRIRKRPATKAPARWLWLFAGTLLALLSHLLLDWTNNYGLRPFFPFNPRWYAGSFVFIFEPVLFGILLAALILPTLFALINSEVGARKKPFIGRGWAIAALFGVATLYVVRYQQHQNALNVAALNAPQATRYFASPYPTDPFRWAVVADNPGFYQLSQVNSRTGLAEPPAPSDTLYKPTETLALIAAKQTPLGRVYLDWSSWPVLSERPDSSDPDHSLTQVTFADARFFYSDTFLSNLTGSGAGKPPPLSGSVLLDMSAAPVDRLVETRMGSRVQH